jgi:hypothetical protein
MLKQKFMKLYEKFDSITQSNEVINKKDLTVEDTIKNPKKKDNETDSFLNSPYKLYLLIFLVSLILIFFIILFIYAPPIYNNQYNNNPNNI